MSCRSRSMRSSSSRSSRPLGALGSPIASLVLRSAQVPEPPKVEVTGDERQPVMRRRDDPTPQVREVLRGGMWIGILERLGLTAAILGGTTAIGAGIVGILYAGVTVGAVNGLQIMLGVPREIGSTVLALMIVLVAVQAPLLTRIERARERRRANRVMDAAEPPRRIGAPAS